MHVAQSNRRGPWAPACTWGPFDKNVIYYEIEIILICSESMTEIVGGPDIYVDRLSTLQLTCRWILCRMANVELLKGKC